MIKVDIFLFEIVPFKCRRHETSDGGNGEESGGHEKWYIITVCGIIHGTSQW